MACLDELSSLSVLDTGVSGVPVLFEYSEKLDIREDEPVLAGDGDRHFCLGGVDGNPPISGLATGNCFVAGILGDLRRLFAAILLEGVSCGAEECLTTSDRLSAPTSWLTVDDCFIIAILGELRQVSVSIILKAYLEQRHSLVRGCRLRCGRLLSRIICTKGRWAVDIHIPERVKVLQAADPGSPATLFKRGIPTCGLRSSRISTWASLLV